MNNYYIKIPNQVLKMKELTSNDKLIYGLINSLTHKTDYTIITNGFIVNALGITLTTVKSSLNRLKNNELITITNSNRHRQIKIKPFKAENDLFNAGSDKKTDELLDRIYKKL